MPRTTKRKLALSPLPTTTHDAAPSQTSHTYKSYQEEDVDLLPDVSSPSSESSKSSNKSSSKSSPAKKLKTSPAKTKKSPSKSITNFFAPRTPKDKPSFASTVKVTPSPDQKKQQQSRKALELDEVVDVALFSESPKKKKKVSPPKRKPKAKPAVSLSASPQAGGEKAPLPQPPHVPFYIHKNIDYSVETSESILSLPVPKRKAFVLIRDSHDLPVDFETRKYGPKSGQTFEQRVLGCYDKGMLEDFRKGDIGDICVECGERGHRRNGCPTLL
ncbi:hypothetical protein TrVE_jg7554 [Triparma verrucosa]|uniref:CCHC-type domain-containing protein n=1 Tax=Triparma verrucosa TaxID=1606542 RepID=A0A9W7BKX4_9STRA|nr:hypothetical protein TrVE_jg7554 [Triparma verrucosa]